MIKSIINTATLFFLIFVCIISCTTEKNQTSSKILVESRTTKYKFVDDKIDSTGTLYERIIYDILGRDSVIENYDGNGSLYLRTLLHCDSAGNKIKSVDFKPDGNVESTTEFKYSVDGKLLERNREHINGGINHGKIFYDDKGNRIKEIWTSKWYLGQSDEWYTSEVILLKTYNDKGYCIGVKESADGKPFIDKKTIFDSLGHIIFEDWGDNFQKYAYDQSGNEIEHLYLDKNNKLVWRWVSVYDTNNVRLEYSTYNSLNEPVEVLKKEMIYQ
ncbi:MAG: hypothetical protein IH618_04455 [Ignavibacteriaceae bacterium]|nr:hypothetical protein [Ignavibacteriaceae bacterium]